MVRLADIQAEVPRFLEILGLPEEPVGYVKFCKLVEAYRFF